MPQQHPNARHIDPNRPVAPPRRQLPRPYVPPAHELVMHAHESFLRLAQAVFHHSTLIHGMNQEGASEPRPASGIESPALGGVEPPHFDV